MHSYLTYQLLSEYHITPITSIVFCLVSVEWTSQKARWVAWGAGWKLSKRYRLPEENSPHAYGGRLCTFVCCCFYSPVMKWRRALSVTTGHPTMCLSLRLSRILMNATPHKPLVGIWWNYHNYCPNNLLCLKAERFTSIVHFLSFQVEVIEGYLICPETERKFPIFNGIPNMLLNEDEIWIFLSEVLLAGWDLLCALWLVDSMTKTVFSI